MERLKFILNAVLTFVLLTVLAISANAADAAKITTLRSYGDWEGGTLANDINITLTGDVDLKGPIVIPDGIRLTIRKKVGANSSDTNLTYVRLYLSPSFTVPAGQIPCMFNVEPGGTLEIHGNDVSAGDFIAIKGSTGGEPPTPMTDGVFNASEVNAFYNDGIYKNVGRYYPDQKSTAFLYDWGKTNGAADNGAMIYVAGSLEIKDAKIASALSTDEAAAIKVPIVRNHSTGTYGKLLLEDVEIRNCYAQSGPALIIYNQVNESKGKDNTPESCSTTLKNCKLYRNYCKGAIGGIIRTGGDVVGNLIMEGTTIYENYVAGYGGALVSAAQGHENTLLIMDGCKIHDNKAATYAGGVMITGGFEFRNNVTKIYKNSAATYGGAMYLVTYNGVKFTERKTLNMSFGNKLELYNNTAGNSGGGICLNMRELTSLVSNSTININFEGANIHDNTAAESGGGIMLTYDNSKVNVNLNFISGTIKNNTATTKDGGGVYCQIGPISGESPSASLDVSKCQIKLNGGTISNNKAPAGNGGGVAVKNLPIYCDDDAAGIKVCSNNALNYGAGIYVDNASFSMNSGSVYGNVCTSDTGEGGGIYAMNSSRMTITGGVIGGDDDTYANKAYNGAGITIADSNLSITNGVIASNIASNYGGGIHLKNTEFEMTNGRIYRNSSSAATGEGGGIYAMNSSRMTITGGVIGGDDDTYANKAFNGAGVFVENSTFTMKDGRVSHNLSQQNGGGIYVKGTSEFTFENGSITNNKNTDGGATGHGAGIYVLGCNRFTITNGEISGNYSANHGGGIYFNTNAKEVSISGGDIKNNTAVSHGGGIYVYGSKDVSLSGTISGNKAVEGGGLYANSGSITISGGDIINNNNDKIKRGGGVLLAGNSRLVFSAGNVSGNKAVYEGAGLYLKGTATCDFSNGNVQDNEAAMGGGVYMDGSSQMTFSDGIIRRNKAVGNTDLGSAYGQSEAWGSGGGIYLTGSASFTFDLDSSVGLYGNTADQVGDDLVKASSTASVVLPNVSDMTLTDYNSKTSELFWVEDYMTGDTAYGSGTKKAGDGYSAKRYRDIIQEQGKVYIVDAGEYPDKYLALSLGREVLHITIIRSGLLKGENAIYRISRQEANDTWTPYSEIIIFGPKDADASNAMSKSSSKTVALYSGTWKVEEIGWAWSYDHSSGAITHTIGSGSSAQEKSFIFMGSKLASEAEGYVSPAHYGESVVTNDFGSGKADTDKGAPASSNSFETITPEGGVSW